MARAAAVAGHTPRDLIVRMLLQTNSYIVPKEKRAEHARLVRRFRQTLARLGCDHFEVYEQVGANWGSGESADTFTSCGSATASISWRCRPRSETTRERKR
jgi:hypothetical protein